MLTLADIIRCDPTPVRELAARTGRYGDRYPVDACLHVTASASGHKRQWRRVYSDGRFYVWIDGRAWYLDGEASMLVLDTMLEGVPLKPHGRFAND